MPRATKKFPRLTTAKALHGADWARFLLGLVDYNFTLWVQDDAPEWCGETGELTKAQVVVTLCPRKRALIWVSPSRARGDGIDPMEAVMHEVVHVLFKDAGICRDAGDTHVHGVVYRLGVALAKAYRAGVRA